MVTNGELIGDGISKFPFLKAVRKAFPDFEVVYWTPPGKNQFSRELQPLSRDLIDENVEFPLTWGWRKKGPEALQKPFGLILDLQHRIELSLRLMASLRSGEKYRNFWLRAQPRKGNHLLDKIFSVVPWPKGFDANPESYFYHPTFSQELVESWAPLFEKHQTWVGLAPGAGSRNKCWPLAHFIAVAHSLHNQGIGTAFILGPQDTVFLEKLKDQCPWAQFPLQAPSPPSESKVLRTASLTSYLSCTVTNDAGVGHILGLGHQPQLVLYGPTTEDKFNPRRSGIFSISAPSGTMDQIPPEQVLEWIHAQLPGTHRISATPAL